ncbi:hypothetical protein BB559_005105 [Furculomyces boomerangus]|uniref:Uncharacterized protein n=1 Tax=Furculomyces boomerangus TaxID=61424 RepID=A0A2T9YAU2_9FUNG|nr:hypothetical protein BB559_005105 [Furculomyces boomerangus]
MRFIKRIRPRNGFFQSNTHFISPSTPKNLYSQEAVSYKSTSSKPNYPPTQNPTISSILTQAISKKRVGRNNLLNTINKSRSKNQSFIQDKSSYPNPLQFNPIDVPTNSNHVPNLHVSHKSTLLTEKDIIIIKLINKNINSVITEQSIFLKNFFSQNPAIEANFAGFIETYIDQTTNIDSSNFNTSTFIKPFDPEGLITKYQKKVQDLVYSIFNDRVSLRNAANTLNFVLHSLEPVKGNHVYTVVHALIKLYGREEFFERLGEHGFHLLFDVFYRRARAKSYARMYSKNEILEWLCKSAYKKNYKLYHAEALVLFLHFCKTGNAEMAASYFNRIKRPLFVDKFVLDAAWRRKEMDSHNFELRKLHYQVMNFRLFSGATSTYISNLARNGNVELALSTLEKFRKRWISAKPTFEKYFGNGISNVAENDQNIGEFPVNQKFDTKYDLKQIALCTHTLNSLILMCVSKHLPKLAIQLYIDITNSLQTEPDIVTFRNMVCGSVCSPSGSETLNPTSLLDSKYFISRLAGKNKSTKNIIPEEFILDGGSELLANDREFIFGLVVLKNEMDFVGILPTQQFILSVVKYVEISEKQHILQFVYKIFNFGE